MIIALLGVVVSIVWCLALYWRDEIIAPAFLSALAFLALWDWHQQRARAARALQERSKALKGVDAQLRKVMAAAAAWSDAATKNKVNASSPNRDVCNDCNDHREYPNTTCAWCGEPIDEDGNTESNVRYCSRQCGCVGPGCPMGLERRD